MTADELFEKFVENFPKFKPMVRTYYPQDNNSIKIYTKKNKAFLFEYGEGKMNLTSVGR